MSKLERKENHPIPAESTVSQAERQHPYLSMITASRNDDHGGNALRRMEVSILSRLEQIEKYKLKSELVLVEWNPPSDRPLLRDTIQWPARLGYCTIRDIVVPAHVHQRYEYWEKTPMNVIVAINCGIRRARGEYVLPCNIDLLYSNELIEYVAACELRQNERYRIDRSDVDKNVVTCTTLDEQLEYCRNHIIHVNKRGVGVKREKLPVLHTNACGDFQLMSRENWWKLRGYREADIPSAYADGLLSFASFAAGIREVILGAPNYLYHIDHGDKFTQRPAGSGLSFEDRLRFRCFPDKVNDGIVRLTRILLTRFGYRLKGEEKGIPTLHYSEYRRLAREMVTGKRSFVFNDEDWGLGRDNLEEYFINVAEWDKGYGKD